LVGGWRGGGARGREPQGGAANVTKYLGRPGSGQRAVDSLLLLCRFLARGLFLARLTEQVWVRCER
jgi:hypothetical protein